MKSHSKPVSKAKTKLVEASLAIAADRPTDQDKAFLARQLVQTTLPHSDPGNVPVWTRSNGSLTLTIQQGYDDNGEPFGHPFGTIPRLLMYWMTTEAIRTGSPRLALGDSLAAFMDELGLDHSRGGKRSDAYRLKNQMTRLFEARVSFTTKLANGGFAGEDRSRMQIADRTVLWWDIQNPRQRVLWNSYVDLDQRFFSAITANPVPVDLRALHAIKRSPLALDLYSLLTYQAFRAARSGQPRFMTWKQFQVALGTSYSDTSDLRHAVKSAVAKIAAVYPGLAISEREGGLEVLPESLPAISAR